jgi:hypothetical protein
MQKVVCAIGVALCLVAAGCGGGGNPTGPTNSIPNVVGTYSGNVTIAFPELNQSLICPATTSVTQSGSTASIAPMILRGDCGNLSLPLGQVTIDNTGAFPPLGTVSVPADCGTYSMTGSGGFFGRELRISINATSNTCYNFNFTATLTR